MSDLDDTIETGSGETPDSTPILHIDNFDGPLDLLWDLIKKAKIDITEITISHITEQYLAYLAIMEKLNVRVATDFIRMASELIFYKSCALLPAGQIEDEYFVPPLPPELVQKLLEFKKFQNTSRMLLEKYQSRSDSFTRENRIDAIIDIEDYAELSLFDLLRAFAEIVEAQKEPEGKEIVFDEILVSDRIEFITGLMAKNDVVHFPDIFTAKPSRMEIVVTLMAILELARKRAIRVLQHKVFGTIRIVRAGAVIAEG